MFFLTYLKQVFEFPKVMRKQNLSNVNGFKFYLLAFCFRGPNLLNSYPPLLQKSDMHLVHILIAGVLLTFFLNFTIDLSFLSYHVP